MKIVIDDVPSANLAPYFDRTADKINDVVRRGGKVLVHCMAGISRSSTLCIAYLMKHKGTSLPVSQYTSYLRSRIEFVIWTKLFNLHYKLQVNIKRLSCSPFRHIPDLQDYKTMSQSIAAVVKTFLLLYCCKYLSLYSFSFCYMSQV